jgi:flavin reductase (DIM6/NTAB) family NADH-FMN oxidoreductase RutF
MKAVEPQAPDPLVLREALGCFATGVTIVTCRDDSEEPYGVTVNSFNSVSLEPPLILFSLARSLNSVDTFQRASHLAVNVLATHQRALSARFATALTDKWRDVPHRLGSTGCPLLEGSLAVFECESWHQYDGGDHVIFVCRVLRVWRDASREPLLFFRGAYGSAAPDD